MNYEDARHALIRLLQERGQATNIAMHRALDGDVELFEEIREELILEDIARDKDGVGLLYVTGSGPASATACQVADGDRNGSGIEQSDDSPGSDDSDTPERPRLFLSYGRRDAKHLADRLSVDLTAAGYEVWQDTREIRSGSDWQVRIVDGLRSTQLVVALLSPHAVRVSTDPGSSDNVDSACLDELSFARFSQPPTPIVPVMAVPCEPPFCICRLDYVEMTAWQQSEDSYQAGLTRLLEGLELAQQGKQRFRTWDARLKPWDFTAFLYEKRQDFTGRQWLFDEIDAWRTSSSSERALLITGDPGTGKSAIVAELVHRNPDGQVLAYHCCQADTQETLNPARFVQSLAAMIASKLDDYAALLESPAVQEALADIHVQEDPASAFEAGILTPLESLPAPENGPLYILVDALDEALTRRGSHFTIVHLLASRMNRLPGWLRIVATTRKESAVLNRLRGLRAQELDAQDARNLEDIDRYIRARLQEPNLAERLTQIQASAERVATTLKIRSAGNFLYVRQALDGIERDEYRLDELERLPPGLYGLYQQFFERHFPIVEDENGEPAARGFDRPRRLLQVLAAAEAPLSEAQLALATELEIDDELPAVLSRLAAWIPRQTVDDGKWNYRLFHKSLGDWLTSDDLRGTPYYIPLRRGHERLARMGQEELRRSRDARQPQSLSNYTLRHLTGHLTAVEHWDGLEELLTDLPFLEAKTQAGLVFELAADLTRAATVLPSDRPRQRILDLLYQALLRDIEFIARHADDYPQGLFQCLWNTGWWYDCAAAAEHYVEPEHGRQVPAPWESDEEKLHALLERWREQKEQSTPGFPWVRALRPPSLHLGSAQRAVIHGHNNAVSSVSYSPDGRRIVSGSSDGTVRVWDPETCAELHVLHGDSTAVSSVWYSPDGRYVFSGSLTGTVRIWDAETAAEVGVLNGNEGLLTNVSYSPDGRHIVIVIGTLDGMARPWDDETVRANDHEEETVRVWDAETGEEVYTLNDHEEELYATKLQDWWMPGVTLTRSSPDGRHIVMGVGKTVAVCDLETGEARHVFQGHEHKVSCVSYSPDGRHIVSGSYDKTVRVWDAEVDEERYDIQGHKDNVKSVSYSPDSRYIVSGSLDKTVRVWDAETGAELHIIHGHRDSVVSLSYSSDGRYIVSGSVKTVRVWDAGTGAELHILRGHEDSVMSLSYSPNGPYIASGSCDKTVRVWDAETGEELHTLGGHEDYVISLSYSPDGRYIVSGSCDKTVRVWDAETGEELHVLRGHEHDVISVSHSPDGRYIVSGSCDKTVRVWDAETGAGLHILRGHELEVTSVSYSRDGRRIVSDSGNIELTVDLDDPATFEPETRVWDAETGECLEVSYGSGDADEIAESLNAGLSDRANYRATVHGEETIIVDAATRLPVARYPVAIEHIKGSSRGQWAGSRGHEVCIIQLEGAATAGSSSVDA